MSLPCAANHCATFINGNNRKLLPLPATSISVIIPAINESEQLPALISFLKEMPENELLKEIIITDGGSTDNTVQIAETLGAIVVKSDKGRAIQMNNGAKIAKGNLYYFLHADTFPPANAWKAINDSIDNGADGGCFRLGFDTKSKFLQVNAWFTRFDINAIRFGDQSLFIKKKVFKTIGGFDEKHLVLEDQDIIKRLRKRHRFKILPFSVRTSDRKYRENGNVKLQCIFFGIYLLYKLQVPQQRLVSTYKKWIKKSNM